MAAPDQWTVSGGGISIFYSSLSGGSFDYQDVPTGLIFAGQGIRLVPGTDVGTLVSVTLRGSVEAGSATFTLLLPACVLIPPSISHVPVHTIGITTVHRVSPGPGQKEFYQVWTQLTGIASI